LKRHRQGDLGQSLREPCLLSSRSSRRLTVPSHTSSENKP
jgi:hypothetical protein